MIPLVRCPNGHLFHTQFVSPRSVGTYHLSGNKETCPVCGALSDTPDGVFRLGDELLRAIRAPDVTKGDVIAFLETVEAIQSGGANADAVAAELEQRNAAFATILKWTQGNAVALGLLLGLLTLIVACYSAWSADEAAAQAHIDAQETTQAIQKQSQAMQSALLAAQSVREAKREIDEKIQQLNEMTTQLRPSEQPTSKTIQESLPQTRQQRRRLEQLARKRSRQIPPKK